MESMHNAADMLQLRIDNSRLVKDNANLNEKLVETAKEINELKLRHIFEMDEIKLEYEERAEKIEKLNSQLQTSVEDYQRKILKLHEDLKEKEEEILEVTKCKGDDPDCCQKPENKKRIKEIQREIKVLQSENKYLKAKCHNLEQTIHVLTTNCEKLKAEQLNDGNHTASTVPPPATKNVAQGFISTLDACDNQLQSELTELHALLKEKRKTIKEIKKKRIENNNKDSASNFKITALEEEIQKLHAENNTLRIKCNDLEISKSQLTDKMRLLEEKLNDEENSLKKEIEKLEKEVKEKEDTITWIEAKMLESFDSMALKTSEYEEKIKSLEGDRVPKGSVDSSTNHEIQSNDSESVKSTRPWTPLMLRKDNNNDSVAGMLFETIDNLNERGISGGGKGCSSKNEDGPKTPKMKGRGGLRNIFSKSFRSFVRNRRHAKKLTLDHDVFYVSEKE